MSDLTYIKKPCKHCPFRSDVKPFLTAERGADLAYSSENPYNTFPCHKTIEYDEESENMEYVATTKECAGFLTLRATQTDEGLPDGFEPSFHNVYSDSSDMAEAYENAMDGEYA